jgi:hypothetical protein
LIKRYNRLKKATAIHREKRVTYHFRQVVETPLKVGDKKRRRSRH